jgi:hypothetical protein
MIIKNILDNYNLVNNIKSNNYKIIWDLCLVFLMFGNDHIPSSFEIGPELGMDYFMKTHYNALNKLNIVNIKKSSVFIDMNNFYLLLKKFNENKQANVNKIILQRFFKINNNMISLLVDKFKFTFEQVLEFLKKFTIYRSLNSNQIYDENDNRFKFIQNLSNEEINYYKSIDCFKLNNNDLLIDSIKLIEENIDYYADKYMGLIIYNKPFYITEDPYQDIYNYISEKANNIIIAKYPEYYEHTNLENHINIINNNSFSVSDYLKKIYQIVITQFGSMKEYHSDNITFYTNYYTPSIQNIINYIENNKINEQTKIWYNDIMKDNIKNNYISSLSHHILITPFINKFVLPENIAIIIKQLDYMDNLWLDDINTFKYRNIDIMIFLKNWEKAINNISNIHIDNQIINLNLDLI